MRTIIQHQQMLHKPAVSPTEVCTCWLCLADRYNMHTGEWMEFTAMSNDKFKELYG